MYKVFITNGCMWWSTNKSTHDLYKECFIRQFNTYQECMVYSTKREADLVAAALNNPK